MDRRKFFAATAAAGLAWSARAGAGGRARVRGDAGKGGAAIDRRIYGQNFEFMGRQFEGGIMDQEGIRADVRDAIAELGVTHLRWPGGCFADAYDWRDGVGGQRPSYKNPMWDQPVLNLGFKALGASIPPGPFHDNRFGTDEFIEYCQAVGAEPSLTASMGTQGPEPAADWVAYVREKFGPRSVPVWSVGNEQWNPLENNGCYRRPKRYVRRFAQWAEAMRAQNPEIELAASGANELSNPGWNRTLIEGLGREADYFSTHIYVPFLGLARGVPDDVKTYLGFAAANLYMEESLDRLTETMVKILGEPVPIAFDEWNLLASARFFLDPHLSLREAIGAACVLHSIHRRTRVVKIADMFAAVNAGSPEIITGKNGLARTPMFHALKLYSDHTLKNAVPLSVSGPSFSTSKLGLLPARKSVPVLEASLTTDQANAALFLVNRSPDGPLEVELEIEGIKIGDEATVKTVTGPSFSSQNPIGGKEQVSTISQATAWPAAISLPPHSITLLTATRRSRAPDAP
ncbi:MAG TPA: alpha-L-arabinofuranosidase C-terminal domain-containing protein [bacterium]|nr:alpha-L-arabinofuranosidase C-terminal domain-containing protein [bacterium]